MEAKKKGTAGILKLLGLLAIAVCMAATTGCKKDEILEPHSKQECAEGEEELAAKHEIVRCPWLKEPVTSREAIRQDRDLGVQRMYALFLLLQYSVHAHRLNPDIQAPPP